METKEESNWNQQRFHPLHKRLVTLEAAEVERDSKAIGEEWLWDKEKSMQHGQMQMDFNYLFFSFFLF